MRKCYFPFPNTVSLVILMKSSEFEITFSEMARINDYRNESYYCFENVLVRVQQFFQGFLHFSAVAGPHLEALALRYDVSFQT